MRRAFALFAFCMLILGGGPFAPASAGDLWIGTAPFCAAKPHDCRKYGMEYVKSDKRGGGKACVSGKKVLCRAVNPRPGERWLGTAPFCAATKDDCRRELGMRYRLSAQCGDGNCCATGTKVLCTPDTAAAPGVWLGTAPACAAQPSDCTLLGLEHAGTSKSGNGKQCVTGKKVLCRAPPRPALATDGDTADTLTVLSYNVFARPFIATHDGQIERTCRIPHVLAKAVAAKIPVDVLVIQEAFLDGCWGKLDLRRLLAFYGWGHATQVLSGGGRVSNGGVFIASKWPILRDRKHIYAACERTFEDCLAAKGVQYVEIRKTLGGTTRDYHVFGTHLQAQDGAREAAARKAQGREIAEFMRGLAIPATEAVVFAGDLNVNMNSVSGKEQLDDILGSLNAELPRLVGEIGPIAGWTRGTHGAGTGWLDYVVFSRAHRRPAEALVTALDIKAPAAFKVCMEAKMQPHYVMPRKPWCGKPETIDWLSDHRPVLARLRF